MYKLTYNSLCGIISKNGGDTMGSAAQTKASVKHNKSKDSITIRPDRETGSKIREAAKERGISVTELILSAVKEYTK